MVDQAELGAEERGKSCCCNQQMAPNRPSSLCNDPPVSLARCLALLYQPGAVLSAYGYGLVRNLATLVLYDDLPWVTRVYDAGEVEPIRSHVGVRGHPEFRVEVPRN